MRVLCEGLEGGRNGTKNRRNGKENWGWNEAGANRIQDNERIITRIITIGDD